jgi:hypothetical protein
MAGFLFRLETPEGAPADPPTLTCAVPDWQAGDTIDLGAWALRVVRVRDDDVDQAPVLVVEDMAADVSDRGRVKDAPKGTSTKTAL